MRFMRDCATLLNAPRPAVNRHAAAHPAVAFGHRFIPLEFWVNGARYSIRVSMLFLAVLALVEPLDNSLPFQG